MSTGLRASRSVVVLVDYQSKLLPVIHEAPATLAQAVLLGGVARLLQIPVIGTEQHPTGLGHNVDEVRDLCSATVEKQHFDACADGLLDALPQHTTDVVVAGCETHVCLLQTALGLHRAGRRVHVVAPACGSRRPDDRHLALGRLAQSGLAVVSTEMVVFEWLSGRGHPQFREVLALIKNAS
jgi:nicotinamidase-related amidase